MTDSLSDLTWIKTFQWKWEVPNFSKEAETNKYYLVFCKRRQSGGSIRRWCGHLSLTCCNFTPKTYSRLYLYLACPFPSLFTLYVNADKDTSVLHAVTKHARILRLTITLYPSHTLVVGWWTGSYVHLYSFHPFHFQLLAPIIPIVPFVPSKPTMLFVS